MNLNRFFSMLFIILLLSFASIFAQQEKIIYSSNRGGTWDIWTYNPEGSNHEQLTYKPGQEISPRISPDGSKIAYIYGGNGDVSGLYIIDRDGTNDNLIIAQNVASLCWSPDGDKILYGVATGHYQGHIRMVNVNGTDDQPWLYPHSPYTLAYPYDWKNDKIIYTACYGHSGNYRIFIIDELQTESKQLTYHNGQLPRFNPDGSKIAYLDIGSWGGRLRLMDIETTISEILQTGQIFVYLCFSPDGNEIAFGERFVSNLWSNLFTINIHNLERKQITFTDDINGADEWMNWEKKSVQVALDIKPGSYPNPLNAKSKGVLPVAILGTEDFDVNDINVSSIELEGVSPTRYSFEDMGTSFGILENPCHTTTDGADGLMDLSLKFETQNIVTALEEFEDGDEIVLTVTGELHDGTPIEGNDCVVILAKGKLKKPIAYNADLKPITFNLSQNYPNPFNPSTTIRYSIPTGCNVKLDVYNYNGQKIDELITGFKSAGIYETPWTANVASGVYFYRFEATPVDNTKNAFVEIKKMIFTR
jgi:hypothetical protein